MCGAVGDTPTNKTAPTGGTGTLTNKTAPTGGSTIDDGTGDTQKTAPVSMPASQALSKLNGTPPNQNVSLDISG